MNKIDISKATREYKKIQELYSKKKDIEANTRYSWRYLEKENRIKGICEMIEKDKTEWKEKYKEIFARLSAEINKAEGQAWVRTLTVEDIFEALCEIESVLNITHKKLNDVNVQVDVNAQVFSGRYKYTPMSTVFYAIFHNGWKITDICRDTCYKYRFRIHHTQTSAKAIVDRFSDF